MGADVGTQLGWIGGWVAVWAVCAAAGWVATRTIAPETPFLRFALAPLVGAALGLLPSWAVAAVGGPPIAPLAVWVTLVALALAGQAPAIAARRRGEATVGRDSDSGVSAAAAAAAARDIGPRDHFGRLGRLGPALAAAWPLVVLAALFVLAVAWRLAIPAVLHTEKPMEMALVAASATGAVPPLDPWLAGERLNYYLWDYTLLATLGRLAGIPPTVTYNLGMATMMALAATGAATAAALLGPRRGRKARATLGALALFGIGNGVAAATVAADGWAAVAARGWWDGVGWAASRAIHDGGSEVITEFPLFSVLLGDVHAHVLAAPFVLAAVCCAIALWAFDPEGRATRAATMRALAPAAAIGGLCVGVLAAANTWDVPVAAAVLGGAILARWHRDDSRLRATLAVAAAAPALAVAALFAIGYRAPRADGALLGVVTLHSGTAQVAAAYGVFGAVALLAWPADARRFLVTGGALAAVALATGCPALVVVGLPLAAGVLGAVDRGRGGRERAAYAVVGLGAALALVPEWVFLRDIFGARLNTVFKLGFAAWVVAAPAVAALGWRCWHDRDRWVRAGLVVVAAVGLLYPVLAIPARLAESHEVTRGSLDALDAVASADERAGLRWVRDHLPADAVVAEAPGCSYAEAPGAIPFSRVSAFTGRPTILGWSGHEYQWRLGRPGLQALIETRQRDASTLFATADPAAAAAIVARYGVHAIYAGTIEQAGLECPTGTIPPHPPSAAARAMLATLPVLFQQGDVTIYAAAPFPPPSAAPAPGAGASPAPGTGASSTPGAGASSTPGAGASSTPGAGASSTPGAGASSTPGAGASSTPGAGASPVPPAAPSP